METKEEEFCGCTIKTIEGDEYNTYVITHNLSNSSLYTCNRVSAYRIAKLLDLEYVVTHWSER